MEVQILPSLFYQQKWTEQNWGYSLDQSHIFSVTDIYVAYLRLRIISRMPTQKI